MGSRAPSVAEDSIPLYCALCPERVNFSDVSHLLTHISSKSHLSRKFDTELRAKGDDEVYTARLTEYERWYEKNRIDELLRRRMETKQRRRPNHRDQTPAPAPAPAPAARNLRSSQIERRGSIKVEPRENSADVFDLPLRHPRASFEQTASRFASPASRPDTPLYRTPTPRRTRAGLHPSYAEIDKFEREASEPDSSIFDGTLNGENFELQDDDTIKLKGTVYPGMAGFDAASPDQRRKRNQKKDKSVVQNMRESSQSIEALECVWNGIGNFGRSRDIYASPSIDGSPVSRKAELPAKRKKKHPIKNGSPSPSRTRPRIMARRAARSQQQAASPQGSISTVIKEGSDGGHDSNSWTTSRRSRENADMFRADGQQSLHRMASPLQGGRYHLNHRSALQQLDNNAMMAPPGPPKHYNYPYFGGQQSQARDVGGIVNQPGYHTNYMLANPVPGDGNFNPLSLQRGVASTSFAGLQGHTPSVYDGGDDRIPNGLPASAGLSTTEFQPINPRFGFHGMHANNPNPDF